MEQNFKIRRLEDLLPKADKTDIITLFMALQRQNFALANTVSNLVKKWPNHLPTTQEAPSNAGTSLLMQSLITFLAMLSSTPIEQASRMAKMPEMTC